ncbi:helix-turn-helix domain-containing protein [Streptomyces sp. NPDC127106]|uniref:helix-turn-helix domain-containing protein n=1 Tax=Streptomyces sp. NPDC127106 TaxID=3345360 RepID=UPI0036457AEF
MGRPEQTVPHPTRALGRLALGLRAARQTADLTYHQLAATTPGFSRPTLQRAESGRKLPTKDTVTVYALACGIDTGPLLALWEIARAKERAARPGTPAPDVRQIRDEAGAPSYGEIEKRTRDAADVVITRKTAHRVLSRQRFPSSREQLRTLLTPLGVPAADHEDWLRAWSRVDRRLQSDRRAASKKERKDRLQRRITRARQTPPCDDRHPRPARQPDPRRRQDPAPRRAHRARLGTGGSRPCAAAEPRFPTCPGPGSPPPTPAGTTQW